jgi:LPXTG-motif cell wall-anchored protein
MENIQIILSLIGFMLLAGGFYFTTKKRLDDTEAQLKQSSKMNYEIMDRLARIETKLDFYTKK